MQGTFFIWDIFRSTYLTNKSFIPNKRYDPGEHIRYLIHCVLTIFTTSATLWKRNSPSKMVKNADFVIFETSNIRFWTTLKTEKSLKNHPLRTFTIIKIEPRVVWSYRLFLRIDMILKKCLRILLVSWNLLEHFFLRLKVRRLQSVSSLFGLWGVQILFWSTLNTEKSLKIIPRVRFRP